MNLGRRIRQARIQKNLPLRSLAKKTGLTISSLSQIERNLLNPSLASLVKIAEALEIPLLWLFLGETGNGDAVTRQGQRKKVILPGSHVVYEVLSPRYASIELLLATMEPGQGVDDELITHPGEECVFVIEGQLEVTLGETVHLVNKGDSIFFQSTIPHRFCNSNDELLVMITAAYPPTF